MSRANPSKTHCLRGHPQTRDMAYWNGRSWSCKECRSKALEQSVARRRNASPFGFALKQLRRNAKTRKLEFDLTIEDFLPLPTHCPVLGVDLDYSGGGGPNAASIDRTKCNMGYVRGNCVIMSRRANTLKSDATVDELRRVLHYMSRL
jgi:hypothetical protein